MSSRSIKSIGLVAMVAIVAVGIYAWSAAAPSCDSERALDRATELLRTQFNLDSVFLNDIQNVSGNIFSDHRECTAQVAQIKGNVSPTTMTWRHLSYSIAPGTDPHIPDIKIELGANERFVPAPLTLRERIFGKDS